MPTEPLTESARAAAQAEAVLSAAWAVLLELRMRRLQGGPEPAPDAAQPIGAPPARLDPDAAGGWLAAPGTDPAAAVLFELYAPLVSLPAGATLTVGHLGQSLDGCIATHAGDSSFVTGDENLAHLHRMRALSDAIVVGAETVAADDPQLTTRRVPGPNPARVVIDPARRLAPGHRVFTDGAAPTLLICAAEAADGETTVGGAELVPIEGSEPGRLEPFAILAALHERGYRSVFVEGGGATVSRFLDAGVLDRLQIAIAPLVIGRGRPGLRLPPHERLADSLRLAPRVYAMGPDVLFDCDLRAPSRAPAGSLSRID